MSLKDSFTLIRWCRGSVGGKQTDKGSEDKNSSHSQLQNQLTSLERPGGVFSLVGLLGTLEVLLWTVCSKSLTTIFGQIFCSNRNIAVMRVYIRRVKNKNKNVSTNMTYLYSHTKSNTNINSYVCLKAVCTLKAQSISCGNKSPILNCATLLFFLFLYITVNEVEQKQNVYKVRAGQ